MDENIQLQLEIGTPAPNFCLPSSSGNEVCLSDFQRECQIVLFFVREFG
jgi:peroxiredoxin